MAKYICVTGAAGFLGLHVTRALLARGDRVYAVDAMTYAAQPEAFARLQAEYPEHLHLRPVRVQDLQRLPDVDAIVHLAASTHVDNSILEAQEFVDNNVGATAKLLELTCAKSQHGAPHFVHISTDEVYGPAPKSMTVGFAEDASMRPSSPYAASKAAADLLVQAWVKTYDMDTCVLRPTNCYGRGQYAEKLIPKAIRCLQLGRPIPIHGDGSQTRSWLSAVDFASAVLLAVDQRLNGVFNVGGNTEASVRDVVQRLRSAHYGELRDNTRDETDTQYGFSRPACDQRYLVDDTALRRAGWVPQGDFWQDLPKLVGFERHEWRW